MAVMVETIMRGPRKLLGEMVLDAQLELVPVLELAGPQSSVAVALMA